MSSYGVADRQLSRSLNLNIFAITLGMVFFTIFGAPVGSPLFTGFMRMLGAGDFVFSVIMALPVLGALSQIVGAYFLETTGRRKHLFLAAGFMHRLLWIPVALIPLFHDPGSSEAVIWSVTILITLSSVAHSVTGIAFNSWMGSLIPPDIIGRFFGKRALVSTISGGAAGLLVGMFVDRVNDLNGFALVFLIGALFGVADIFIFIWVKHPEMEPHEQKPSLLRIFIEPFRSRKYIRFTVFATVFMFGVNLSAVFFNIYMIEHLGMSYIIIALSSQITASLATVLMVRKWGTLADRYGSKPVMRVCSLGLVTVPLIWLFTSPDHILMAYAANLVGGFFWSGYNLTVFNQSIWLAPEKNRSAYTACFNLFIALPGTALPFIISGVFMEYARPLFDTLRLPYILGTYFNAFYLLFIISALIRAASAVFLLPRVPDEKAVTAREMLRDIHSSVKTRFRHR